MLQRSILLSSRQVYQCRATQAIPVQGPLLDKDVAARLRTLARWVQRPTDDEVEVLSIWASFGGRSTSSCGLGQATADALEAAAEDGSLEHSSGQWAEATRLLLKGSPPEDEQAGRDDPSSSAPLPLDDPQTRLGYLPALCALFSRRRRRVQALHQAAHAAQASQGSDEVP